MGIGWGLGAWHHKIFINFIKECLWCQAPNPPNNRRKMRNISLYLYLFLCIIKIVMIVL